jgi:two-component system LytT family response regulator
MFMELRAIIIDDEIDGIKSLKLLIERFVPELTVIADTTNPLEGIKYINNYRPDVVFLDINMPEISGLELIEKLDFKDFKLVYTTAHEKYAIQALKLGTTDYLLKPIDSDDLIDAVNRVKKKIAANPSKNIQTQLAQVLIESDKKHKILISDKEITEYCNPEDIIRLEARSNYTWVVFDGKKNMLVSKTLKDFEKQLDFVNTPFMRVHQSHIVNINQCLRYKREDGGLLELKDGASVNVSASKKEELLKKINLL